MAGPWEKYRSAPPAAAAVPAGPWTRYQAAPASTLPVPAPPPGVIVHGGDGRSYAADDPSVFVERSAAPGTRDEAVQMQGLQIRARGNDGMATAARAAQPFVQGSTFNLSDELISAIFGTVDALRGGSFSDAYDVGQEFQKQELERERAEHPIASLGSEVAGGVATGIAAAPRVFASGGSLIGNMFRGGAAGTAGGAVSGFGAGDGLEDRAEGAANGAAIGLGVGAAAPAVGAMVGSAWRAIANARAAAQTLQGTGLGRRAADQLEREMGRDGMTPETARARAEELGPEAMVLDLGGNVGSGAEAVANQAGAGQRLLRDRLAERGRSAPTRINDAADAAMGPAQNMAETVDALIAQRSAAASPLYAKALDRPIAWTERLGAFQADPLFQRGLREGYEIQRLDALARGERFDPLDYNITGFNAAGDPVVTGTPNMRTLNTVKKGLDAIVEGYRDPVTGRLALDERGRAINGALRAFVDELDAINPDYAAARAAWSGPTRVRSAMSLGQDVFDRSVRPDDLRQRLAAMGDDEREAFQIGARDQLAEIMGTARRDAAAARALFETGWNKEKLGLLLGDEERAADFLRQLGAETDFSNRANTITGNSATARRLERAGEYDGRRGAAREAFDPTTGVWGDLKRVGARAFDAVLDGRAARSAEEMRAEFGDAVSRQGAERDEILDAIFGYGRAKAAAAERAIPAEEYMRAIFAGGGLAGFTG